MKAINTTPPPAPLPDPLPQPPIVPISYGSKLQEQIDSPLPLNDENQFKLIFELEAGLRDGRSPAEIRVLLLALRRRDDLLAKYAARIDEVLKGLDPKPPAPLWETARAPESASPAWPPASPPPRQPPVWRPVNDPPAAAARSCPRCGAQPEPGARFCTICGAALAWTAGAAPPVQAPPLPQAPPAAEKSKSRRYACTPSDAAQLVADVRNWLNSQGFDYQQMTTENQGLLIQVKKRGELLKWVGMSTSLNIVFYQSGDTLTVEIGAGKWIDKAAVGTVSLFVLWPLAVTAGIGAWEQANLPEKIFTHIGSRLMYR